jgi:hypothetical protein
MARDQVLALNQATFEEAGVARFITVDDAHGSPGQRCPRTVANFCRGRNLRFTDPCFCDHPPLPTLRATYTLTSIEIASAKGDEIVSKFMASAPFYDGQPVVTQVQAIENPTLSMLHEQYREYLRVKSQEEPRNIELYHGCNCNILDVICQHGLMPPSDMAAAESCPTSGGGKGLRTSLCNNDCAHCTERHQWDRCHMYGLGVYLGDIAAKSHRYVSMPELIAGGRRRYHLILCEVVASKVLRLKGHLRSGNAMHDVPALRTIWGKDLRRMVDFVGPSPKGDVEQMELLFVEGLSCCYRPGFSVFNSEYISFHPYQCLPRYRITYEI